MNPLIEPTRKKFELSRYLLRKNIAKLKSKVDGNTSTFKDSDSLILDKIGNTNNDEPDFNCQTLSSETPLNINNTDKKNYLTIQAISSQDTPLVRNSKSVLPRPRLESLKGHPITTSDKTNSTPLQSNITNYSPKNINIHFITNFEKYLHNIDMFDFLSEENNVKPSDLKGNAKSTIMQNKLFVKTLEDDDRDYDYDSDNSDSDESAIEKKLSNRLSSPLANAKELYKFSSFLSRVSFPIIAEEHQFCFDFF